MHNTDKCNYFDPTTKSEVEVPTMQNAFGVVSHAGGVVGVTTPPQHPCFFIAVPVLTPFANGYLPYHIDQIHLASNYLLASFTLSIAGKARLT